MRGAALLLALGLAALGAVGCGGGDSTQAQPTAAREAGGEASIERFGNEAAGAERTALLGAFRSYLEAIASRQYPAACLHLSGQLHRSLAQVGRQSSKGTGCATVLPLLLAPTAAAIARQQARGQVTKARVRDGRAFVVFHAPGAELYQLPMTREGGRWKASLLAASVLVPSAATLGQ